MKYKYKIMTVFVILFFFTMCFTPNIIANTEIVKKEKTVTSFKNGNYDLLIITPDKWVKNLKPLSNHKENVGIKNRIIPLSEIYDTIYWNGRDDAEKIKYYIKNAYEYWGIRYVLLVGGHDGQSYNWNIPVRYVDMGNSYEAKILSDLYFADLIDDKGNFSSWDTNYDQKYMDWYDTKNPIDTYVDFTPEIAVGRLPCRNSVEVKNMVNKIIKYEQTAYNKEWFKKMVAIAGDTYPEYKNSLWKGYEGEHYADMAFENMTGFEQIRLYTSLGNFNGPKEIIPVINKGCGILYFVGHGNPMVWANHYPNDEKITKGMMLRHMFMLYNFHKTPVTVVSGCHNSQFDITILNIIKEIKNHGLQEGIQRILIRGEGAYECFSWLLTNRALGGSVSTLGCTALGFTKEDKVSFDGGINELEVLFFKEYGQNKIDILGDAWKNAITNYNNKYPIDWNDATKDDWVDAQIIQTWALFGDPSLKIGGYPEN